MNLWHKIKSKVHKDEFHDRWIPDAVVNINPKIPHYKYSYRLIERKFFFFYTLENECISTNKELKPNEI